MANYETAKGSDSQAGCAADAGNSGQDEVRPQARQAQLESQIKRLVNVWYDLIGSGHHKDRDCHFYIEADFSYDGQVQYCVYHNGYLSEQVKRKSASYIGALEILKGDLLIRIRVLIKLWNARRKEGDCSVRFGGGSPDAVIKRVMEILK